MSNLQQYRGVGISLISYSEIRYVGILDEVNQSEFTISLTNVKCFGTEGRLGGDPAIEKGPVDSVFGYICFRASDVKELSVISENNTEKKHDYIDPQLIDPAIINISKSSFSKKEYPPIENNTWSSISLDRFAESHVSEVVSPEQPIVTHGLVKSDFDRLKNKISDNESEINLNSREGNLPTAPKHNPQLSFKQGTDLPRHQVHQSNSNSRVNNASQKQGSTDVSDGENIVYRQVRHTLNEGECSNFLKEDIVYDAPVRSQRNENRPAKIQYSTNEPSKNSGNRSGNYYNQHSQIKNYSNHRSNDEHKNSSNYRGSSNRYHGSWNNQTQRHQNRSLVIPKEEFDFTSSNAKLKKDEVLRVLSKLGINSTSLGTIGDASTVNATVVQHTVHDVNNKAPSIIENNNSPGKEQNSFLKNSIDYYDSSRSFFDNISCEALERNTSRENIAIPLPRGRGQEERRLNLQTFGTSTLPHNAYHRSHVHRPGGNSYRGGLNPGYGRGNTGAGGSLYSPGANNYYHRHGPRNDINYNNRQHGSTEDKQGQNIPRSSNQNMYSNINNNVKNHHHHHHQRGNSNKSILIPAASKVDLVEGENKSN